MKSLERSIEMLRLRGHEATTSRGTHRHPQVAERSTKRKGKTKRSEDLNGAGNTP